MKLIRVRKLVRKHLNHTPAMSTINGWCSVGLSDGTKLPAVKIGKIWHTTEEDMREFIEKYKAWRSLNRRAQAHDALVPMVVDPDFRFPDDEPCPHPRGSPEKVEFLARRMERGYSLWNEADNQECAHPSSEGASKRKCYSGENNG